MTNKRSTLTLFIVACAVVSVALLTVAHTQAQGPGSIRAAAGNYRVIFNFSGGLDGGYPHAGLAADGRGNFYGTTKEGGVANIGVIFKITAKGSESVLYSFSGVTDGVYPEGTPLLDALTGNLYGTTSEGGDGDNGTVYKLAPDGTKTVLHSFAASGDEGLSPQGNLVRDPAGNLYGTTYAGGPEISGGVVFKLAADGTYTILHAFSGGIDGLYPNDDVVADAVGNIYGTTPFGGNSGACTGGCGTVFEVSTTGIYTLLYSFQGGSDGFAPEAGLAIDSAGNLYGTTSGTVFRLDSKGTMTVLYRFQGGRDGSGPNATLYRSSAGDLYGTTLSGGDANAGTIFKVASDGTETILHSFFRPTGDYSQASLTLGPKGFLFGTTYLGGRNGVGVVFAVRP